MFNGIDGSEKRLMAINRKPLGLTSWWRIWEQGPADLRRVARGTGSALLWQMVGLALGYAVHVALARWLGATEYGRYTYVLAWVALFATPVSLGLPLMVVRFVPEYRVQQAWSALRGLVQWSSGIILLLGAGVAGVAALGLYFIEMPAFDLYLDPLLVGCCLIPLQALINLAGGLFRGLHRVGWQYAIAPVRHGLLLGAILLFVWWSSPATSVQVLLAVGSIAVLVLVGWGGALVPKIPPAVWQATPAYRPRKWLGVSLPLMLVGVFVLLMGETDILMLGTLVGPFDTGLYRAASRTASLVSLGPIAIGAAADPMLVRHFAAGNQQRLQQLASVTVRWGMLLALGAGIGLVIFAEPLLTLFGKAFVASRGVLAVLVAGQIIYAGIGLAAGLLNLTGHQRWGMAIFGASALLNIVFNGIGITLFGSMGAAIATVLAMLCLSIALWWQARLKVGVDASIFYALWRKETPDDET